MKLLLTFFIFICLNLSGRQECIYTSNHVSKTHRSLGSHLAKEKAIERTGGHSLLMIGPDSPCENEVPIFVEDEEEDNTRKCKLPIESFSTFLYAFITSHPWRYLTIHLSVRRHLYHINFRKYIAQRVLRI